MPATIPADIAQYYGYMLRTAQKLMYLYGFPQAGLTDEGNGIDSETINMLTLCLGVMYGVAGANNAVKTMAKALATAETDFETRAHKRDDLSYRETDGKMVWSEDDERRVCGIF